MTTNFDHYVAIGDPQAPFERFLAILERHGLLVDGGRLRDNVHLVSMGDHFDWGGKLGRKQAADDALRLLEWLLEQPAEQVTLLLGNHDVARVTELAPFDDATFQEAQLQADRAYNDGQTDKALEAAFLRSYACVPTAELVARDYATFRVEQQHLVSELLHNGRFQVAHEHNGLLLTHAAVTMADLEQLGIQAGMAAEVATQLNAFLASRVAAWQSGALDLFPFHQPGSAAIGEGRGALYHRPADPEYGDPELFEGPPRRRFDPRGLPSSFAQAIGHIRDNKCRDIMPAWHDQQAAADGPLRSLSVDGSHVTYVRGCAENARLYFVDNGMYYAQPEHYQLLDLNRRQAYEA